MGGGPIFIGGLDRSGKTTLRLMLSSHPNIALTRRTYMWTRFYNRFGDLHRAENFERCLQAMLSQKSIQALHPDPERIRREFKQSPQTYADLFALFQQHFAERAGKPRWGDQLAMVERFADVIFGAYPQAKMIHMLRDPRQRPLYASAAAPQKVGRFGWSLARWQSSANLAKRNRQRYPQGYLVVRYEALLERPEETLRAVCAFLGEEFTPAVLSMEDAMRFGDEQGEVPSRQAVPPGEAAVPIQEQLFAHMVAARDLAEFDYPAAPIRLSLPARLLFYLVDLPVNTTGLLLWKVTEAKRYRPVES